MNRAVEIQASSFDEEVLGSGEPVVVEFFSHACPHCKRFNPVYERLSEVLGKEAQFFRIDVLLNEENRQLAIRRGVRGIPTIEVFYQGRCIGNIEGYHPLEKVVEAFESFIAKKDEHVGPSTPLDKSQR